MSGELSEEEIKHYKYEASRYNLKAPIEYWMAKDSDLVEICNGVGPEWFPEKARKLTTELFKYFLPSTNIHDYDYDKMEKTEENFSKANYRLKRNMKRQYVFDYKKAKKDMSWLNQARWRAKLIRYRRAKACEFLYKMCDDHGKKAFMEAK